MKISKVIFDQEDVGHEKLRVGKKSLGSSSARSVRLKTAVSEGRGHEQQRLANASQAALEHLKWNTRENTPVTEGGLVVLACLTEPARSSTALGHDRS